MGYTSGVAMDQRGLRDVERWRDKIEVRLDNRQVFFLFFGSALVACLLFVLGVVVGKRLESRGRALAPEVEDPLALLDKVASTPRPTQSPAVTFPQTLFGGKNAQNGTKRSDLRVAEPKLVEPSKSEPGKVTEPGKANKNGEPNPTASSPPEKASTKPTKDKAIAMVESKPATPTKSAEAKATPSSSKPGVAASSTRASSAAGPGESAAAVASAAPEKVSAPAKSAPVPVIGAAATDSAKGKAHFTLQLSSFQDRAEAESFAAKFGSEKTYLVVSNLPGKGTWYRVRVGDFATSKDAFAGKATFEKKYGVIAYVAQR
jgi:DedD protein